MPLLCSACDAKELSRLLTAARQEHDGTIIILLARTGRVALDPRSIRGRGT